MLINFYFLDFTELGSKSPKMDIESPKTMFSDFRHENRRNFPKLIKDSKSASKIVLDEIFLDFSALFKIALKEVPYVVTDRPPPLTGSTPDDLFKSRNQNPSKGSNSGHFYFYEFINFCILILPTS